MKVCDVVIQMLVDGGVRYFAGMVGSTTVPMVASVARNPNARYIPIRHEQVAASIVDATARITRRPGCALLHSASGTLAASLGVAAAARDSTPMIVLTGTQERLAHQRGYWQTMDVLGPLSSFTKWQMRLEHPQDAPEVVRRALIEAVTGRPGVVHLDIPIDVSTAEIDGIPEWPQTIYETPLFRPRPETGKVEAAAALILAAEQPVILVGGGAVYSGAGPEIQRLAERLNAPIVDTGTSRGVVSEEHPLSLGPSGITGFVPMGEAITTSDLIIAIGSRLSDLQLARGTLLPERPRIIQVDVDPTEINRLYPVELGIVADARSFVEDLNARLDGQTLQVPQRRRDWAAKLRQGVDGFRESWIANAPKNGKVQPQEVVHVLMDALPTGSVLTHGAGDHGFYGYMVPVEEPQTQILSVALGAMGSGLAYALGAKLARPDRTVVACVGDGDFMLQLGDLETMVREQLPVVVIVFNNFRLGSQRPRMEQWGHVFGVDHTNPDFAKLGGLFGCDGYRVDQPGQFRGIFEQAVTSGRPTIIDVIVDPEAHPPRIAMSRAAR